MAIIKVNNTSEESSVNFLTNQSSILYTSDTNKITANGVNVFVIKPKVGDIMCVTRYTGESGAVLPADQQQVKWIDGLSINPKQLSQKYEPVGICVAINGNKAMVRYREEKTFKWSASERWEMPQLSPIITQKYHSFIIELNGKNNLHQFNYRDNSFPTDVEVEKDFVRQLNDWFSDNARDYSVEIVDKDTDLPTTQGSNDYRIIVNARFTKNDWNTFSMVDINDGTTITPTRAIGKPVEAINWYYKNNGFKTSHYGGCCRAMYYDFIQANQNAPTGEMENINIVPGGTWFGECPARLVDFNDNDKCKILRDNFATYDEYLESMLVKLPCGAGGQITEFPSGKENTYKLANCTFLNKRTGKKETLYPAANWAASIDVNAPKLGKGNWWLPSAAETVQMMRDINLGTSFWDSNPDIVNRVLHKLTSIDDSGWSMLSASTYRWTSSRLDQDCAYLYGGDYGFLTSGNFYFGFTVAPITLYEF